MVIKFERECFLLQLFKCASRNIVLMAAQVETKLVGSMQMSCMCTSLMLYYPHPPIPIHFLYPKFTVPSKRLQIISRVSVAHLPIGDCYFQQQGLD